MSPRTKIVLLFVILIGPAILSAVTAKVAFTRAESVSFCGSCHTMTPWINDVTAADSDSLAHEHFEQRWIQHDQCFTCHSNYSFLGPLEAKIKGVRHVIAFYVGERGKIELYGEFPNANCLQCHAEAKGFLEDPNHEPIEDLLTGKDRCVECHEDLHAVEQEEGSGEEVDADAEQGEPAGGDAGEDDSKDGHDQDAAPQGGDDDEE